MPGEEETKEVGKPAAGGKGKKVDKKEGEEEKKQQEEEKKEDSKKPKIGKMKTREGDSTKLMDLLDEAKNRTLDIFRERMKEDEEEGSTEKKVQVDTESLERTAEIMGISSIKYYDLK